MQLTKLQIAVKHYGKTMTAAQFEVECMDHGVSTEDMLDYTSRHPVIDTEDFFMFLGY